MLLCGADEPDFLFLACGPNAGVAHPPPTDYRLKPGDTIKTDCGAIFSGYRSDIARTAVVGPPSDEQRRTWDALIKTQIDSIALMRAGNRGADVYNGTKAAAEKHGLLWMMPHQGHGVGVATHERPMLQPFEEWELQPNMMFCVETRVRWAGKTGYNVEDLVQVTDGDPIVHTRVFPAEWLYQI
jgi:Xaa-Pro aminopeptidase